MNIEIICGISDSKFDDAKNIRRAVFCEEQHIPDVLDSDGKDENAFHLIIYIDNKPVGVGRLLVEGTLGILSRIAVIKDFRKKGLASIIIKRLEQKGIEEGTNRFELYPHAYLESFYRSLGFILDPNYSEEVAGFKLIRMHKKRD